MFLAGCVAAIGATTWPVHARTEAEAADELIAVLGVTLPCPHYATAWLEPPTTIEYRCTTSVENAISLRQSLPSERVGYIIDMQMARERFASVYGFRGRPASTVALAQFLAGVTFPEQPRHKAGRRISPLIVYRRSGPSLGAHGATAAHHSALD